MRTVDMAGLKNNWILTVAQKHPDQSVEKIDDLHDIGTLCKIESIKGTPETGYFIVVRGYYRMKITSYKAESEIFEAYTERLDDVVNIDEATQSALLSSLREVSQSVLRLLPGSTDQIQELILGIEDVSLLSHLAAANSEIALFEKQKILEMINLKDRVMYLLNLLQQYKGTLEVQQDIRSKLHSKLGQTQREHILREQMKTIKEELGDDEDISVTDDYQNKINALNLPKEALELAQQQLKKLQNSNTQSPEYQMIRSHLDLITALPWSKSSEYKDFDILEAEKTLDADHYGLAKESYNIYRYLNLKKINADRSSYLSAPLELVKRL